MSEAATEAPQEQQAPQEGEPQQEAKTFDAEYVANLRKEAAKYRTEAKANAEAAKKLAEIEDAKRTEAEKVAARIKQLETEAESARRDALRFKIASKFKVDDEDAELFLTGTDEDTLTRQAERLASRAAARQAELEATEAERKKKHPSVPKEGTSTKTGTTTEEDDLEFARSFFGGGS